MHVLITGGTGGIGSAMVRLFAQKGHKVSFTYHTSKEKAQTMEAECGAFAIMADGKNEASVQSACLAATDKNGAIDALVNCAGISSFQLFQDVSTALWEEMMQTNVRSAFFYAREVLPAMIAKKAGCILNISSIWGMVGASCEVLYSTTKAALIGMTKALAKEVGPSGIRVNCIAPGAIDTPMNRSRDESAIASIVDETPLGRLGEGEDIAKLALYLAAEDSFLTGQVISPNGGFVIC